VNKEGWRIWIQNKQAGYKIVSNNWSGKEPLKLKLDHDLPCECGEFQADICEQNGESVTTLFFRYIPSLRLNYSKELIIPDSKKGHRIEKIEISLQDAGHWEIETPRQTKSISNGYKIDLPPEEDTLRFSISKKDKPETKTNFKITIPRLKWRTLKQADWIDKPLHLKREELVLGEDFYFSINTNSSTKYDILAVLEANNQKLQESKLVRKGKIYNLLLNQFYDTIKKNKNEIVLKIKILKERKVIGENIPIMHFPKILVPKPVMQKVDKKLEKSTKNMRPVVKGGRDMREGKGFSKKEILQAGMEIEEIRRLNIPYDKRRRSVHRQNVEILKSLIGGGKYANRSN